MKKTLFLTCLLFVLSGCRWMAGDEGQKVFYWERPNTGVVWFAKDHRECMREADMFPFEWPSMPWGAPDAPKPLNLRFDNDAPSGVWAQFVPFPGAKPVFVNAVDDDWAVDYDAYEDCMTSRHYRQRLPATQNHQVFQM